MINQAIKRMNKAKLIISAVCSILLTLAGFGVALAVTETGAPSCRWPHATGSLTTITYKWGNGLQTSGSLWRNAFEAAITDWNNAPTRILFSYSSTGGKVTFNTYNAQDNLGGYAQPYCSGSTTTGYSVYGNVYYDIQNQYSVNTRHAYAGHETGHSQSIGHISGSAVALMGNNPDPNIYYTPKQPDKDLVNQIYP